MSCDLILASGSQIRLQMLQQAQISVDAIPARIDESALRDAMQAEDATPHDIADALAESKARKISAKHPQTPVLGCDQVLDLNRQILAKPQTKDEARGQIRMLRNQTHALRSAAVLYEDGKPVWRHVGTARLTMRDVSDAYIEAYLDRNWPDISTSVGGYKLEKEGVRLFSRIDGNHFTILGLPLLELLNYLTIRGILPA